MRRVKTTAIAACTVTFTLVATPALAAPYPVPNAKTELLAAIDATNAAASYQYLDNSLGWTAAFTLAGQYQQVTVGEQRVFNGVGNYTGSTGRRRRSRRRSRVRTTWTTSPCSGN